MFLQLLLSRRIAYVRKPFRKKPYFVCHGPGAHGPLDQNMDRSLTCFDECSDRETVVTSGLRDKGKHSTGRACDIGRGSNSDLSREPAENCFAKCFSKTSYGQEERNRDRGTHFHIQLDPTHTKTTGFPEGVVPYGQVS